MRPNDELRTIRHRHASQMAKLDRLVRPTPGGNRGLCGSIVDGGAMPEDVPAVYLIEPERYAIDRAEGATPTVTTDERGVPVLVLGPEPPAVGDRLCAERIQGGWIADGPGEPGEPPPDQGDPLSWCCSLFTGWTLSFDPEFFAHDPVTMTYREGTELITCPTLGGGTFESSFLSGNRFQGFVEFESGGQTTERWYILRLGGTTGCRFDFLSRLSTGCNQHAVHVVTPESCNPVLLRISTQSEVVIGYITRTL